MVRKKPRIKAKIKIKRPRGKRLLKVYISREQYTAVRRIEKDRGVGIDQVIGFVLQTVTNVASGPLKLDHHINFGKYRGTEVETAVRLDPSYFLWLRDSCGKGNLFTDEVFELATRIKHGRQPFEDSKDMSDDIPF